MPIYTYECKQCLIQFEKKQSMTEASLTQCPSCVNGVLRRVINCVPGIAFKGSGFYVTDSKSPSSSPSSTKTSDSVASVDNTVMPTASSTEKTESKDVSTAKKDTAVTATAP